METDVSVSPWRAGWKVVGRGPRRFLDDSLSGFLAAASCGMRDSGGGGVLGVV